MSVKRVFVEKRPGFRVEAESCLKDFRENLGITELENVRVVSRYDVENISDADFDNAVKAVLSEPAVDSVEFETLNTSGATLVFGVEYLPGQYDQRADNAAQCIQLLTRKARPVVRSAKIYVLYGKFSEEKAERVKKYIINPVDSREASIEKPETLAMKFEIPTEVEVVNGFTGMTREEMAEYKKRCGFVMSLGDMLFVQKYFNQSEKRNPTITELKVIDTYWSDHCRHTTFLTKLEEVSFEHGMVSDYIRHIYDRYLKARDYVYAGKEKNICLMDMATIGAKELKKRGKLSNLDESEEINACSFKQQVKTDKGEIPYYIMFKNETHNHPTEIEPFGGAATCLGGAIRDPLSGRSYVYQAMRVTGSGDPREKIEDTLQYKLPQKKITREAAKGYSSYGNQIGLATGHVAELYHQGYKAKRMEVGAVVGAAPQEHVIRRRPRKGDCVVLIGGRTGRDGIGGATGSSKAHDEKSTVTCGAEVQKGNPLTERNLQRLFRNAEFTRLVKRCNDFGAGGVSVAIGELADSLDIYLDNIPKKYEGLDGTELAISESQERMAVVIDEKNLKTVIALSEAENLEAVKVADVTETGRLRMMWNGAEIVSIKREFLDTNGVTQTARANIKDAEIRGLFDEPRSYDLKDTLMGILEDLNVCSKKGLVEMFDSTIGANTVLMPFGGKTQMTPAQVMAAKVPVLDADSKTATIMAYGCDPYLLERSPMHGAVYAVLSSIAKLVAAGGDYRNTWLSLQEFFESLGNDPDKWGNPVAALLGAWLVQQEMEIGAIGGKDSMSGTFMDIHVPPTLCSFAICTKDADKIISPELKQPGNNLYFLDIMLNEYKIPQFEDVRLKYEMVTRLIDEGKIVSAYAVERGGILAAAVKMAMGNEYGVDFGDNVAIKFLTKKKYGTLVIETPYEMPDGCGFTLLGKVIKEPVIKLGREEVSLKECMKAYNSPLEKIFPTKAAYGEMHDMPLYTKRSANSPTFKYVRPRVTIPVFPGTNCEYDSKRAFEKAGAVVDIVKIRNISQNAIDESVARLANSIRNSQIVMIPGGFSGGDEPDGSGKFIATVFRNGMISDAVMELLKKPRWAYAGHMQRFPGVNKIGSCSVW